MDTERSDNTDDKKTWIGWFTATFYIEKQRILLSKRQPTLRLFQIEINDHNQILRYYTDYAILFLENSVDYDGRVCPLFYLKILVTVKTVPRLAKFWVRWIIP